MTRPPPIKATDLRGAARLATEATAGLTDLVEALHERIGRLPGAAAGVESGRTRGITGLVYKSIHGVTRLVGGSVDALLGLLAPAVSADGDLPQREALVAALNGVLGDHLAASHNPLATTMVLRHAGRTLAFDSAAPSTRHTSTTAAQLDVPGSAPAPLHLPGASGQVLVLLHGLCMHDGQWQGGGHDHGAALARDLGFTPIYLRYNSGLHVGANGRALALQLEQLRLRWPQPLQRLVLLGHSMGGLVARSAVHHAQQAGLGWPAHLSDMLFLGTPHHGAPLERAGHWLDRVLAATPYTAPFARLGKLRSAGITDLRFGNLLDADGADQDRIATAADPHQPIALPPGMRCFAVATRLGQASHTRRGLHRMADEFIGDGLVPLDSALGRHADPARQLAFAPEQQWVGDGIDHLQQLYSAEVYAQLRNWLTPAQKG